MKRTNRIIVAVVALFVFNAWHNASAQTKPEEKRRPGPETKALSFYLGTMTGKGKLEPGAFGPGSPAATSKSKQVCKWTVDDFWIECDLSDTAGTGKDAQTWNGHMLIGWDVEQKSYRSVGVDNMGTAFDLNGKLDGKKFILESARETTMMGQPVKFRFTLDMTDPKAWKFTEERSQKGGAWQLVETTSFTKGG